MSGIPALGIPVAAKK